MWYILGLIGVGTVWLILLGQGMVHLGLPLWSVRAKRGYWSSQLAYGIFCFVIYGISIQTLWLWLWGSTLMAGATIDLHYYVLPDEGALLLLVLSLLRPAFFSQEYHIFGLSFLGSGAFLYILRKISCDGLGLGDIKWCMSLSSGLPLFLTFAALGSAFLLGAVISLLWHRQQSQSAYIPFGPFLTIAFGWAYIDGASLLYYWRYLGNIGG